MKRRVKNKKNHWEQHTYRYANNVPLAEGEGALRANWCEVTITRKGKQTYHNAFITDWNITDKNVAGIVAAGRARWKIENENNNTLKRRGYHLKHNFGHGERRREWPTSRAPLLVHRSRRRSRQPIRARKESVRDVVRP